MYLQDLEITLNDLAPIAVIDDGELSTVRCVREKKDKNIFALKTLSKEEVVAQNQQKSVVQEREVLSQCSHPFIVQFIKTLQDAEHVYFLTEFLGGGDLFSAIREIECLSKAQSCFFSGCIILGLEYLHARGVMYRDLKPENIGLDEDGYGKLADFGSSKKALRSTTLTGTPEYTAPEVISGRGYTCTVDWWALGVIMHEFLVGPLPFAKDTEDCKEVFTQIIEAPLEFPADFTDEDSIAILRGLLDRTPESRLGSSIRGAKDLKVHPFFAGFDWPALCERTMKPPWRPNPENVKSSWEYDDDEGLLNYISLKPAIESGGSALDSSSDSQSEMEWTNVF